MGTDYQYRLYATLKSTEDLRAQYYSTNQQGLTKFTRTLLQGKRHVSKELLEDITVLSAPSLDWQPVIVGAENVAIPGPNQLVIAYGFQCAGTAQEFIDFVIANREEPLDAHDNAFLEVGSDPGGNATDHWCPGSANRAIFGHRANARTTVNADALTNHQPTALNGQRVNVVIIDQGLNQASIGPNWGGGLGATAGQALRTSHGMMIARSILDLAPNVVLYDVPLIPPRITSVPVFASTADAVYRVLIVLIALLRTLPRWSGPWILVNAWAIFDRASEWPLGSYTQNTAIGGHPLINIVAQTVQQYIDVIFAAGNCGQFCPSQRCGGVDRGPGHSIWGANAHPLVITAGAVAADETWLGYSSQGPGPVALATRKPDICAPSQFCETYDAAVLNSGSSTACAMTAGVVAALRSNPPWDQVTVTPGHLKLALITSARKTHSPGWDDRLGFGILDAANAINHLP
jgi:Subtilase family